MYICYFKCCFTLDAARKRHASRQTYALQRLIIYNIYLHTAIGLRGAYVRVRQSFYLIVVLIHICTPQPLHSMFITITQNKSETHINTKSLNRQQTVDKVPRYDIKTLCVYVFVVRHATLNIRI